MSSKSCADSMPATVYSAVAYMSIGLYVKAASKVWYGLSYADPFSPMHGYAHLFSPQRLSAAEHSFICGMILPGAFAAPLPGTCLAGYPHRHPGVVCRI